MSGNKISRVPVSYEDQRDRRFREFQQCANYTVQQKNILYGQRGMPFGFTRLSTNMPLHPEYRWDNRKIPRTVRHIGQRKLLLSEIEFLSYVYGKLGNKAKEYTVVYAGAADGEHIPFMINRFFKGVFKEWHLYDEPHRFKKALRSVPGVTIVPYVDPNSVKGYFTEYHYPIYAKQKIVFISDIRRETNNRMVKEDNDLQNEAVMTMNPKFAMLKFRFPFDGKNHTVLDGRRLLQCWAKQDSAEVRLWSESPHSLIKSSSREHETQMNAFNLYYRPTLFTVPTIHNRIWSYDDMAEYEILCCYCKAFHKKMGDAFRIKQGIERFYSNRR